MQSIPIDQLQSSPAASFKQFGDQYVGVITAMKETHQTDTQGKVKLFPSGDPMPVWIITIETADGETVSLWAKAGKAVAVKGSGKPMMGAIVDAVKAAGAKAIDVGAKLGVVFTGESDFTPPLNPTKLFTAQYAPPAPQTASIPVDLFSQQQT